MFVSKITLALAVLGVFVTVLAADFNITGALCAFVGFQRATGNLQVLSFYQTCVEMSASGIIQRKGIECTVRVLYYSFEALAAILSSGYGVAYVANGMGGAQEQANSGDPPARRAIHELAADHKETILGTFNNHFTSRPDSDIRLRATDIVFSHLHPEDGYAIRTNVRGGNTTMHVHTNGTHAMTVFDPGHYHDDVATRDLLNTDSHYYSFDGVNDFKMDSRNINTPTSDSRWANDISLFSNYFAGGNQDSVSSIAWMKSDLWDYQICSTGTGTVFMYGNIVMESTSTGLAYEPVNPPGCT